jgi:hypothetical protein
MGRLTNRFAMGVLVATAACAARAQSRPGVGDVDPVPPSQKVERALNGTFDFPAVPPQFAVRWQPDDRGFAKDRLFSVPPPGTHPRVLFGPEDLPRIRTNLAASESGSAMLVAVRTQLAKGIDQADTWEGQCFAALTAGDLDAFRSAYKESPLDNNPPGSGFRSNVPGRKPAVRWGTRNPLLAGIEAKAFVALLDDDAVAGKQVAAALETYARFLGPKVDAANAGPRKEFHWASTRDFVGNEVAFGYDWAWRWMTPAQRETLRSLIVRATVGKYTVGMDLPPHWRNWNHLGMTESYALCLFAVEGEEGFDGRGLDRIFEVYRDYLTYGINELGTGTEGVGYQTLGIGHLSSPLLAFANRGKSLFIHPHYRRHTESWLVQTMQPFGGQWMSNSDLGNFPPSLWMLQVQKHFFPDSPGIDYVYRSHPLIAAKDWPKIAAEAVEAQWVLPAMPGNADTRDAAQRRAAEIAGDPLTYHDRRQGVLYTRTGWGANDLNLHIDCRIDTTFANHDHPDRGQFTLSAHGRAWACDGYRDTEGKYHNVVTIDGRGQGYFATPGKWVSTVNYPEVTGGTIDAKYCFDWMWMKSSFTESRASLEGRGQGVFVESALQLQSRVPLEKWETDPTVKAYYEGFATREKGDPRMWDDEDGWVVRAPWYPVRKAFRSVLLARGNHPYVLVVDDLRKDDAEHLYEWRMNLPPDVSAVSIDARDILLGDLTTRREPPQLMYGFQGKTGLSPAKGDRLLLVRTLDIAVPDLPTLQPPPMIASIEYKKTDDSHQFTGRSMGMGTQVVIGSRSVEPKFVILLYPHAHGDELPKTAWSEDRSTLTVAWGDQTDTWTVTAAPEGFRRFERSPTTRPSPR